MRYIYTALFLLMLVDSRVAKADNDQTFDITGQFQQGETVSGTLVVDETTGTFVGGDLVTGGSGPFSGLTFTDLFNQSGTTAEFAIPEEHPIAFFVDLDAASLMDYYGGPLNAGGTALFQLDQVVFLDSGNASLVPEPSAVAVFAIGLGFLGAATFFGRRRRAEG
jgi:hypothetical protein